MSVTDRLVEIARLCDDLCYYLSEQRGTLVEGLHIRCDSAGKSLRSIAQKWAPAIDAATAIAARNLRDVTERN